MKNLMAAGLALFFAVTANAQTAELPNTTIKDLNANKKVAFSDAIQKDKVTLVSFWATWCVPCKKEIKNVREKMPKWKEETDFNFVTVSIDESRAEGLVRSYAKSQGWDFPFYIDPNSDLKRSLNFQTVPFTMIIDKTGKVAYMHSGYEEGSEDEVYAKIKELAK
ncbi:TlpA family protein disulfide reductase [Polluticoccus soli]|uniref:TlpA family protein disulfide reductase n=1 Tax=Polluticoccus soli TaxID=3034150 RepID=UPI0023E2DF3F|nr:TlpA disulfide reductase family protein [Flavipsychrobacter sp. JY13-12]